LLKFTLQPIHLAETDDVEVDQRLLASGVVRQLTPGVFAGFRQADSRLQQLPLGLVLALAHPDGIRMTGPNLTHPVDVVAFQGLDCLGQERSFFEGERVADAKVLDACADRGQVQFVFDGFGAVDVGRLGAFVAAQLVAQVFHQRSGLSRRSRHVGQSVGQQARQVEGELAE